MVKRLLPPICSSLFWEASSHQRLIDITSVYKFVFSKNVFEKVINKKIRDADIFMI